MGFMELAKERYTVRKYADKPLEKEQLDKLLECLLIAPAAKNLQPVRVYVIEGEKNLAKLDELTKCRYGAPCVLAFTYNKDEDWKNSIESGFHSGEQEGREYRCHAHHAASAGAGPRHHVDQLVRPRRVREGL